MTDLLKKAFEVASRLPENEQDAVAEWLLAELASEEGWEGRFARTQDALFALAHEALVEHERGATREVPFLGVDSFNFVRSHGYARDHHTG